MGVFCQIRLNRPPNGIFTPNSIVSGTIKYALDSDMSIETITVSLNGTGNLHIVQDSSHSNTHYTNKEVYCAVADVVHDTNQGNVIKSGSYEVEFKFVLPPDIPASLEHQKMYLSVNVYCFITYNVCIHFKRPKFSKDKKFQQQIIVVRDTRTIPRHPMQLIVHGEKKKLSRLFSSGTIYAKVFIPNSIVVPGGKIHLDCEVINESKFDVKGIDVKLVKVFTFIITEVTKFPCKVDIPGTNYRLNPIASGQSERTPVAIDIPTQYQSYDFSNICIKDFEVTVMIDLPAPLSNMHVHVPFQIGHVTMEDIPSTSHSEECDNDGEDDDNDPPSYWSAMNESKMDM